MSHIHWHHRAQPEQAATGTHEEAAARKIAELTESRRAIAHAFEIERRRIERNLHDGSQQYLVAAMMQLGELQTLPQVEADPEVRDAVARAQDAVSRGLRSLRETVRGIHPHVLEEQGLVAALQDVATETTNRVRVVAPNPIPRLSEGVLAVAYFFASESITNAAKYAPNADVTVLVVADETLIISVVDSGPGGAQIVPGHGLAGMRERLAAVGGTMEVISPPGGPTQVRAAIPLLLRRGETGIGEEGGAGVGGGRAGDTGTEEGSSRE